MQRGLRTRTLRPMCASLCNWVCVADAEILNLRQDSQGHTEQQDRTAPSLKRGPNSVDQRSVETSLRGAALKIGWAVCGCDATVSACCFWLCGQCRLNRNEARFSTVRIEFTFVPFVCWKLCKTQSHRQSN